MSTATAPQIKFYNSLLDQALALGYEAEAAQMRRDYFPTYTTSSASKAIDAIKSRIVELRAAAHPLPVVSAAPAAAAVPTAVFQTGTYTVEATWSSMPAHRTFRVRLQPADDDFAPGKTVLEFLNGPDNDGDFVGMAFISDQGTLQVWKRFKESRELLAYAKALLENPEAALKSATCRRCNRKLTVPVSVHNGLGPDCARKG